MSSVGMGGGSGPIGLFEGPSAASEAWT
jgi:hypothetical protein